MPTLRTQGPHIVQLDDLRVLIRPQRGIAVQLTYQQEADPPAWVIAWPASAPLTRLRFANDEGSPVLERFNAEGEPEQAHAFAVNAAPRGRLLGIDIAASPSGSYSLSQVLGSTAPVASASFGTVETLSTVRVGGR